MYHNHAISYFTVVSLLRMLGDKSFGLIRWFLLCLGILTWLKVDSEWFGANPFWITESSWIGLGLYKTRYLSRFPKITLSFFFPSHRFLNCWVSWRQEVRIVQLFMDLWSRVNGCHLLFSFPFIAFHVAFISFHVPFILHLFPFILHLFPFALLSCPCQMGIRPNAHVFVIFRYRSCYRLAIGLEACAGCHLRFHEHVHIWAPYRFFPLVVLWAGNALAVLKCKLS